MIPEGEVVERPDDLTIAEKVVEELISGAPHMLALKAEIRELCANFFERP